MTLTGYPTRPSTPPHCSNARGRQTPCAREQATSNKLQQLTAHTLRSAARSHCDVFVDCSSCSAWGRSACQKGGTERGKWNRDARLNAHPTGHQHTHSTALTDTHGTGYNDSSIVTRRASEASGVRPAPRDACRGPHHAWQLDAVNYSAPPLALRPTPRLFGKPFCAVLCVDSTCQSL